MDKNDTSIGATPVTSLKALENKSLITEELDRMPAEERKRVEEIASQINIYDSQSIIQYGVGPQSRISTFSDNVLNEVRAKESGYTGEILTNLMIKVKDLDVDGLSEGGFLKKIPFLGSLINAAERFVARYQKLSVEIERIIDELEKARMQMLKDISLLDSLYGKNVEYLKDLNIFIAAAYLKLQEISDKVIPELRAKAEASGDPVDAQKVNDLVDMANRFDKKIHDLKLSRMISIQTAPQIRLIQNNDQVLVEKIQSSILNTIPLWKNQIVIAITMLRQKKALEIQRDVTDTTNELLLKNADMLKQNTIGVAKEAERGIVEIETLKKVNDDLLTTIDEVIRIQQEGKEKRKQAEMELAGIENDLKNKLMTMR